MKTRDWHRFALPHEICNAPAPQKILIDNVRAGHLGQKSRRGLYDWFDRDEEEFRRQRNKRFIELFKAGRGGKK